MRSERVGRSERSFRQKCWESRRTQLNTPRQKHLILHTIVDDDQSSLFLLVYHSVVACVA